MTAAGDDDRHHFGEYNDDQDKLLYKAKFSIRNKTKQQSFVYDKIIKMLEMVVVDNDDDDVDDGLFFFFA